MIDLKQVSPSSSPPGGVAVPTPATIVVSAPVPVAATPPKMVAPPAKPGILVRMHPMDVIAYAKTMTEGEILVWMNTEQFRIAEGLARYKIEPSVLISTRTDEVSCFFLRGCSVKTDFNSFSTNTFFRRRISIGPNWPLTERGWRQRDQNW